MQSYNDFAIFRTACEKKLSWILSLPHDGVILVFQMDKIIHENYRANPQWQWVGSLCLKKTLFLPVALGQYTMTVAVEQTLQVGYLALNVFPYVSVGH